MLEHAEGVEANCKPPAKKSKACKAKEAAGGSYVAYKEHFNGNLAPQS